MENKAVFSLRGTQVMKKKRRPSSGQSAATRHKDTRLATAWGTQPAAWEQMSWSGQIFLQAAQKNFGWFRFDLSNYFGKSIWNLIVRHSSPTKKKHKKFLEKASFPSGIWKKSHNIRASTERVGFFPRTLPPTFDSQKHLGMWIRTRPSLGWIACLFPMLHGGGIDPTMSCSMGNIHQSPFASKPGNPQAFSLFKYGSLYGLAPLKSTINSMGNWGYFHPYKWRYFTLYLLI